MPTKYRIVAKYRMLDRLPLAAMALLAASTVLAQSVPTPADPRLQAAIEDLARRMTLPHAVWTSGYHNVSADTRSGRQRTARATGAFLGYERRLNGLANPIDQLVLGFGIGPGWSNASARQGSVRTESIGVSGTLYAVYSPALFLSFPVSVSASRWNTEQSRAGVPLMPVSRSGYRSTGITTNAGMALTLPLAPFFLTTTFGHGYSLNARDGFTEFFGGVTTIRNRAVATMRSQGYVNLRLAYPIGFSSIWVSIGYGHAFAKNEHATSRGEVPLALGATYNSGDWQADIAARAVVQRASSASLSINAALRYRF